MRTRKTLELTASYIVALVAILLTLFPIYWILNIALKTQREAFAVPPRWIFTPIWDNFEKVFNNLAYRTAFANTVVVTVLGVAMAIVLAILCAYALNRFRFRGRELFAGWLLLAYMLPEFLYVIPMYALYQQIGLYDTHIGLALVYQVHSLPFAIWMLRSFFQEVPRELDDSARVDGCTYWGILWRIYIPVTRPGIAATAILTAIWIWNELTIALALSFSNAGTITVAVASFRGYAAVRWGEMAAASILAILPMLIFAIFAQKYIVSGLTLGSVKG
jgi:ABC-type glycerol-3-phosphate transport system permease component